MAAARVLPLSVADHLAFEESGDLRHESIGGEIHARATGWQGEVFTAPESLVEFRSIGHAMTVAESYEDVRL